MASFNQSPLSQSSLALQESSLVLGTAGADAFPTLTNTTVFFSTGPDNVVSLTASALSIYPAYRRAVRLVTGA